MDADIFIPFTFFAFLAAIIIVPRLAKERTKRSAHDLVSQAISRGQNLDPALIAELTQTMLDEGDRARQSLGKAIVLLALAGGFLAAGYAASGWDDDVLRGMSIPAIILSSVGVAYLLLAIVDYATKRKRP